MSKTSPRIAVVIPNWNGADMLAACLEAVLAQSLTAQVIVVDNASVDDSRSLLKQYPAVKVIEHDRNRGFAGGVNTGIRRAMELNADYVALLNNDAQPAKDWLQLLVADLERQPAAGIAAAKMLTAEGQRIDSTGEFLTVWALPFSRGRGEPNSNKYDQVLDVFGASGGASVYRIKMLEEIGLFDEDFFAYYEDIDLSFRAQLAGWKVRYVPQAVVHHQVGATSGRVRGFTTYQTLKNLPQLLVKNVPRRYLWRVSWRFCIAQTLFFGRAVVRGHGWSAIKGKIVCAWLLPKTLRKRRVIQGNKKVTDAYIWSILVHDLPPSAHNLKRLRAYWWRLRGRQ